MDVDLGTLTLQISANSTSASASINSLRKSLEGLNITVSGMTGLTAVTTQLRDFARSMSTLSAATGTLSGFKSAANAVKNAVKAFEQLQTVDAKGSARNIKGIVKSLEGLQSVEKAGGFTSTVNSLKKLPDVAKQLDGMDMTGFASRIQEITVALQPLATEIDQISNGFGRLPNRLNQLNVAANRASAGTGRFGLVLNHVFSFMLWRRIGSLLGNIVKKSTEYVEDLNLFTVAMGQYANEAQNYAEQVSEVMGIDVAQWMRAQGVFQTLATGFGVSADRAAIMSKNLTQLAYDISSFYNLDVDKAMQKLESGFAGEIEPVRRLGYDLSKTTLQATAASLGITKLFADMTQAEKSQLRYYALMTQVTQVQGDMARTLSAPANQLRILTAQLEMTKRALGNIFIPALNAVLPYLIAFAKFVRLVADEIARFFGYTLPGIDYSDISVGIGDVEDSVDDLSDSLGRSGKRAKELKGLLASFDELNIIQSETGGGGYGSSGGLNGAGSGGWNDFALPEYDFLKNALTSRADEIFAKMRRTLEKWKPVLRWIRDHLSQIFDIVKAIGLGLLGWKLSSGVAKLFGKTLAGATGLGIGLTIGGFSLEFSGARNIGAGKAELWDYIKTALGAALGIAGSLLVFGTGPVGWIIGIGAAITIFIAGVAIGDKERVRDTIAAEFREVFEGTIDPDEYANIVKDRLNSISSRLQSGIEIKANVEADLGELSDVLNTLDNFQLKLEGVGSLTSDEIDEMNAAFERLYTVGGSYIKHSWDLLESGLLNALNILPEETHEAISGYLKELGVLENNEKDALQKYTEAYEKAMNAAAQAADGSTTQQKYLEEAARARAAIALYTGEAVDAYSELAGAMARANVSIDDVSFDSMDSIRDYLTKVKEAYNDSASVINDYWGSVIAEATKKMEAAKLMGDTATASALALDIEALKTAQKQQLDDLADAFDRETLPIANRMTGAMEGMFGDIAHEVATSYPGWIGSIRNILPELGDTIWTVTGGDAGWQAREAGKRAQEWYNNYLEPLAENMDALGTPRAAEVAKKIRDGWENGLSMQAANSVLTEATWKDYINNILDTVGEMENDANTKGQQIGSSLTNGINNSISQGTAAIGRRLKKWFELIRPSEGDAGNPFSWGTITVHPFATGGFPRAGSLFLAGEGGGAELVGSMGNQTAVANGDQIVAGIAYGVSMANAEETRLMREQNGLLRQIIAAVLRSGFTPSPESGAMIQSALDMYATQRGY